MLRINRSLIFDVLGAYVGECMHSNAFMLKKELHYRGISMVLKRPYCGKWDSRY